MSGFEKMMKALDKWLNGEGNEYDTALNQWLCEVRAEAWEEGFSAGVDLGMAVAETMMKIKPSPLPRVPDNPYRQEKKNEHGRRF